MKLQLFSHKLRVGAYWEEGKVKLAEILDYYCQLEKL